MANFIAFIQIYSLLHMLLAIVYGVRGRENGLVHVMQMVAVSLIILSIVVWPEYIFRS